MGDQVRRGLQQLADRMRPPDTPQLCVCGGGTFPGGAYGQGQSTTACRPLWLEQEPKKLWNPTHADLQVSNSKGGSHLREQTAPPQLSGTKNPEIGW